MCARCADYAAASGRKMRWRRIESGLCPQHGMAMHILNLCPACLYEQPAGQLRDLSFEGLLSAPSTGDKLESCVGCENCSRTYHEGSNYSAPRLPHGLKLKDQHVGEKGKGMRLLFSQEDEEGVPTIYERCSTPDQPCVGKLSKSVARDYLSKHRRGKKVLGMCFDHSHNPEAFTEIIETRLQQQLGATVQPQNGDELRDDSEFQRFLESVKALADRWEAVRNYPGRSFAQRLKMVTQADIGPALGVHQHKDETEDNYGNRIRFALRKRGATQSFPVFRSAVAEGIERGESNNEVARRLWAERPGAKKAA